MSGDETFAARWSRLKRASAGTKKRASAQNVEEAARKDAQTAAGPVQKRPASAHPAPDPPFDPATLPPIDSIVAGTDIRAFLQKGVPAELTKAALRRAWTSDPAIRDFIGIAENQWDFTDPSAIPGFGPLEATGDLPRLVAQGMGELPKVPDVAGPPEQDRTEVASAQMPNADVVPEPQLRADEADCEASAAQHREDPPAIAAAPSRKGHGGALPR
jgi:hypothetical protein